MKILILNGSPHSNGNTKALVDAFSKGAQSAGHEVVECRVGSMNIRPCLGCEYCPLFCLFRTASISNHTVLCAI